MNEVDFDISFHISLHLKSTSFAYRILRTQPLDSKRHRKIDQRLNLPWTRLLLVPLVRPKAGAAGVGGRTTRGTARSFSHSVPYGPSLRRGWRRGRHEGSESQTKWWSDDTKDRPLLPSACRPSSRSLFSSHSLQSSSLYLRVSVHLRLTSFPTAMMIGVIETAKRSVA